MNTQVKKINELIAAGLKVLDYGTGTVRIGKFRFHRNDLVRARQLRYEKRQEKRKIKAEIEKESAA